jgi:hypothetical protein
LKINFSRQTKGANMQNIFTLAEAMALAPSEVAEAREYCAKTFGPEYWDKAVAHHEKRKLRADIAEGTTRDCDGWKSGFVGYDWSHEYQDRKEWIFYDFFRGFICNSVSRMARGLQP